MADVAFLRPYHAGIRNRVTELVARLGFSVDNPDVFVRGTPDDVILAALATKAPPRLVVCPFHQHADERGVAVDGLQLVRKVRTLGGGLAQVPVLMPVSQAAQAGFMMAWNAAGADVHPRVHVVMERDLEALDPLVDQLRASGVGG